MEVTAMPDTTVYNLGNVDTDSIPNIAKTQAGKAGTEANPSIVKKVQTKIRVEPAATGFAPRDCVPPLSPRMDFASTLSLLFPGTGHLVRGEMMMGLFFLNSLAFVGALSWAILGTLDRLTETLMILGFPPELGVWTLGLIYVFAMFLHLWNVLSCCALADDNKPSHPALSGIASAMLPGLGQLLNGDTKRSAMFLGSLWVIGAAWLLAATQTRAVLESLSLHLPPALILFSSTAVRWTLPAVVWSLAVYDATTSAAIRRQRLH
jgi:hypothetical protein